MYIYMYISLSPSLFVSLSLYIYISTKGLFKGDPYSHAPTLLRPRLASLDQLDQMLQVLRLIPVELQQGHVVEVLGGPFEGGI